MFEVIRTRLQQGQHTMRYPDGPPPELPDRFRGRPQIDVAQCPEGCRACADACPTDAITIGGPVAPAGGVGATQTPAAAGAAGAAPTAVEAGTVRIDLGRCLFCTDCTEACPEGAIRYTQDHRLAVRERAQLVVAQDRQELPLAAALDRKLRRLFGRSLALRQVSAGGCNACEADVNVLNTIGWDIGRFGIRFVASPRHADGLLITGPVTRNMELALQQTYAAVPEPKLVIAVGACAISGGPYLDHAAVRNGAGAVVPVDLYIPGCPPHPLTILDGLLRLLGRLEAARPAGPAGAAPGT